MLLSEVHSEHNRYALRRMPKLMVLWRALLLLAITRGRKLWRNSLL